MTLDNQTHKNSPSFINKIRLRIITQDNKLYHNLITILIVIYKALDTRKSQHISKQIIRRWLVNK